MDNKDEQLTLDALMHEVYYALNGGSLKTKESHMMLLAVKYIYSNYDIGRKHG